MKLPKEIQDQILWKTPPQKYPEEPVGCVLRTDIPKPCPDCERTVCNRRVNINLRQAPVTHWKWYCTACKKYRNPETGEFDCTANQTAIILYHLHKDDK